MENNNVKKTKIDELISEAIKYGSSCASVRFDGDRITAARVEAAKEEIEELKNKKPH